MNILLVTLEYPPFKGGVANVYENIVNNCPKGDKIFVLNNNKNLLISNKLPFLKWLPTFVQVYKNVKKNKIKHVVVGNILPLGFPICFLSCLLGYDFSVVLHGMDYTYSIKKIRKKLLVKRILRKSKKVICMNNYLLDIVKNDMPDISYRLKVVNPGIQNHAFKKSNDNLRNKYKLEDKIILFSLGRLVRRKGFDMIIESLPKITKKVSNLVYVIAGTGPYEEHLKEMADKSCVHAKEGRGSAFDENEIIFLGKISDDEKWEWLSECDIFAMPARNIEGDFEGFGIVYLEANLAGKPVVAGDCGGVADAVVNKLNGLLVNPNSQEDIATSVIELSLDKNLREHLGQKGKERALKEFNWGKQANLFYSIIKD